MQSVQNVITTKHIIGLFKLGLEMKPRQGSLNVQNVVTGGGLMTENRTYIEKKINQLTEKDLNVSISGIIVDKGPNSFVLDDKTDQIQVIAENIEFEPNSFVRVLARVVPLEEGIQLHAVAVQNFSKIDKFLYNKIRNLLHD